MADELEMDDIDGDMHGEMDDIEDMDEDDLENEQVFWSCNLQPDVDNDLTPPSIPGFVIHITSASFGVNVKSNSRTVISTIDMNDKDVPICVLLEGKHETHPLNLVVSAAMPFKLQGKNVSPVSLTGYIAPPNDMNEDALSMDDDDDENAQDLAQIEADDEQEADLRNMIRKRKLEAARGQMNDHDDTKEPPNKRAKIEKGKPAPASNQPQAAKNKPPTPSNANPNANKNNNNNNNANPNANKNKNANPNPNANANPNTNANANQPGGENAISKSQKKKNKKNKKNAAKNAGNANPAAATNETNATNETSSSPAVVADVAATNEKTKDTEKENASSGAAVVVASSNDDEKHDDEMPSQSPKDNVSPKDVSTPSGDFRTVKGGVKVKDLRVGSGAPIKPGQKVSVYYAGQLDDKTIFDKVISGEGFDFNYGKGQVIKGWEFGMNGMKVGGKRRIIVPSALGYGKNGTDNIPPNANLTFTVEVLKAT